MKNEVDKAKTNIAKATFYENGNAIKTQEAIIEQGGSKVSVRFSNGCNPIQQTAQVQKKYERGEPKAIRTLEEKSSKSLKNAEKNYKEMLEKWKKLTRQKNIYLK